MTQLIKNSRNWLKANLLVVGLTVSLILHGAAAYLFSDDEQATKIRPNKPLVVMLTIRSENQGASQKVISDSSSLLQKSNHQKIQKNNKKNSQTPILTTKTQSEFKVVSHIIKKTKKINRKTQKQKKVKNVNFSRHKGDTKPPKYGLGSSNNPKPNYPYRAKKLGIEGRVVLLLTIGKTGKVENIKVETSSGNKSLDKSAYTTLSHWIFEPALHNGSAIIATTKIPIVFKLEN